MPKTLITLLHAENRNKVLSIVLGAVVLAAEYTGTLPAKLEQYRDWLELASFLIIGLNLLHIDPKRELKK